MASNKDISVRQSTTSEAKPKTESSWPVNRTVLIIKFGTVDLTPSLPDQTVLQTIKKGKDPSL
jgi:uncharacterized metal-binding protein YceD (DUF177 family)